MKEGSATKPPAKRRPPWRDPRASWLILAILASGPHTQLKKHLPCVSVRVYVQMYGRCLGL